MQAKKGTEKAGKRIELALVGRKGKEGTDRAKTKAKALQRRTSGKSAGGWPGHMSM